MSSIEFIETVEANEPTESSVTINCEEKYLPCNTLRRPILVKPQVLMGAGPTNLSQRVTEALSKPVMGLYTKELHQVVKNFFIVL